MRGSWNYRFGVAFLPPSFAPLPAIAQTASRLARSFHAALRLKGSSSTTCPPAKVRR